MIESDGHEATKASARSLVRSSVEQKHPLPIQATKQTRHFNRVMPSFDLRKTNTFNVGMNNSLAGLGFGPKQSKKVGDLSLSLRLQFCFLFFATTASVRCFQISLFLRDLTLRLLSVSLTSRALTALSAAKTTLSASRPGIARRKADWFARTADGGAKAG